MELKYVWHNLVSLHVNFHNDWTTPTVVFFVKNCRWGEGKEKEPENQIGRPTKKVRQNFRFFF